MSGFVQKKFVQNMHGEDCSVCLQVVCRPIVSSQLSWRAIVRRVQVEPDSTSYLDASSRCLSATQLIKT